MHPHLSTLSGVLGATITASVGELQPDTARGAFMFTLSLIIAFLTIAHLVMQMVEHIQRIRARRHR